ncbi:MAG: NADH-quinone oxidoreductase subunit L, partial [Chromatiaceae bacterium]|nr:NADH-quinone oxidoreductase subunit L [Candidatus Thioaporhodococcus sediminis]
YHKPEANAAAIKAFIVNRVGDFGFALGIFGLFWFTGSINLDQVFAAAPGMVGKSFNFLGYQVDMLTTICLLLFMGAMGKSAQFLLHTWLPDAMEGPTPVSALIHAATMVTAGVFLVARMSPLFELSHTALMVVTLVGAITAFFAASVGLVQNDIKRVIAYSTLSQLGYMAVALGVSAYSAAIFHLMTHAFFKALLFLGAGSVIIAMHHEQDIRKMGGLWKYMPITWITFLLGTLALIGTPGFAGFYSKDSILEAVHYSHIAGSGFAYFAVMLGVFVTSFYSFRLYFIVFHGKERMDHHTQEHLHETPAVVTVPLILLAIPSVVIGAMTIEPLLFGDVFKGVIAVAPAHDVLKYLAEHFHGAISFALHGVLGLPFVLVLAGFGSAFYLYMVKPDLPDMIQQKFAVLYDIMVRKYLFDEIYQSVFMRGSRNLGTALWKYADAGLIDGLMVNGTARLVGWFAAVTRHLQTGYLYTYAFAMIIGLLILLTWFVTR